jgi:hypothetical protein
VCLLSLAEKKSWSVGFFWNIFFNFKIQWVYVIGVMICNIFIYVLTVWNTLSTVIDDIIPFGSRKRQVFQDFMNFQKENPIKSLWWGEKIGLVGWQ